MTMQQHRDRVMKLIRDMADEKTILDAIIALEHNAYDEGRTQGQHDD